MEISVFFFIKNFVIGIYRVDNECWFKGLIFY